MFDKLRCFRVDLDQKWTARSQKVNRTSLGRAERMEMVRGTLKRMERLASEKVIDKGRRMTRATD